MKKGKTWKFYAIAATLFAALLALYFGKLRFELVRDSSLERAVNSQILLAQEQTIIDLRKIARKPIRKVCLQYPYMSEDEFKKQTGEAVNIYLQTDDSEYILWFFYRDSSTAWIRINRHEVMDNDVEQSARCLSGSSLTVVVEANDGRRKKYTLKGI